MILTSLLLGAALQTKGVPAKNANAMPAQASVVDARVREAKLAILRSAKFAPNDIELRVWSGFSWGRIQGFVMRRKGGKWSGGSVVSTMRGKSQVGKAAFVPLPSAIGGWAGLWRELDGLGVRTIPNEASLPDDGIRVMDATKYLFEVRTGARYHAYFYDAPRLHPDRAPSRTVLEMLQVIETAVPKAGL